MIVMRQQRHHEQRLAVIAKIGRNIAEAQPARAHGFVRIFDGTREKRRFEGLRDAFARVANGEAVFQMSLLKSCRY